MEQGGGLFVPRCGGIEDLIWTFGIGSSCDPIVGNPYPKSHRSWPGQLFTFAVKFRVREVAPADAPTFYIDRVLRDCGGLSTADALGHLIPEAYLILGSTSFDYWVSTIRDDDQHDGLRSYYDYMQTAFAQLEAQFGPEAWQEFTHIEAW